MLKFKDQYKNLANLYDLMESVLGASDSFYPEWINSLRRASRKYRVNIHTLVDLACGTGNTTMPWTKYRDIKVVGVDSSFSMLKIARKKSKTVSWHHQNLRKLRLKNKADAVTCHFDSLNHILKQADLQKVFFNIGGLLHNGGLFQFDLNTRHWYKWLNGREKMFPVGKHFLVAWNRYDAGKKIVTLRHLWFVKKGNLYSKKEIMIKERAYPETEIRRMLKRAGFTLLTSHVQRKLEGKPIRMLYLARKK